MGRFLFFARKYNISGDPRWLHVINAPPCYLTHAYNNIQPSLRLLPKARITFFVLYQKV